MFGQSLLSAFGIACTTDTDQLFATDVQNTSLATYQLNNATTSIPSNTYPGTPSNITYAAGKFGNAAVFNGSSSYIDMGNSSGLKLLGSFSISCWVKLNSVSGLQRIINKDNANDYSGGYSLYVNNSNWEFVYSNGVYNGFQVNNAFTTGIWYNLVVTFDSSNNSLKGYKNNVLVANVTTTGTMLDSNDNLFFGTFGQSSPLGQWLNGSLDQVRIFDTALPQAAVTALYNETTTTAQSASVDYQLANPNSIAYYKMSDATDQLGNYNGTATNVNFNTEGKFGFAGAFNGSSSYISGVPPLTNSNASFTISMWFKTSVSPAEQYLFGEIRQNGTYDPLFQIWLNTSGFLTTEFRNNSSSTSGVMLTDSTNYCDGNWHHVVSILTPTQMKMYIDGNEASSSPSSISGVSDVNNCFIGARNNRGSLNSPYNGKIDQIRIYDSALSAANVTALYNEIECPAVAVTNAFNTVLYTGNNTATPISTGFAPDLVWIKNRTGAPDHHSLIDSVRGKNSQLFSNLLNAENTFTNQLDSFDSNGFTVGTGFIGTEAGRITNVSGVDYVSWNWKAGGADVLNEEGTIDSQVSANTDAGFSIVSWTSNYSGNINGSVGHGLASTPELYIVKKINNISQWYVYAQNIIGNNTLKLNTDDAVSSSGWISAPTETTFNAWDWSNGSEMITYCFHSVDGYQRVGGYSGGSSGSSNVITTGFKPRFLLVKRTNQAGDAWQMFDSTMAGSDTFDDYLQANTTAAEVSYNQREVNFTNNGFYWTYAESGTNISGGNYIFLAIA